MIFSLYVTPVCSHLQEGRGRLIVIFQHTMEIRSVCKGKSTFSYGINITYDVIRFCRTADEDTPNCEDQPGHVEIVEPIKSKIKTQSKAGASGEPMNNRAIQTISLIKCMKKH